MDISLIFQTIQMLAIVILFALFLFTKQQKPSEMQKYASLLLFSMILMQVGSILEMRADTLQSAYYGTIVSYCGEPFALASVFLLVSSFYGKKIPNWVYALIMIESFTLSVIVATNSIHYLYYSSVSFDANLKFSPLVLEHGPLYFLNLAAIVIYNAGITYMTVRSFLSTKSALKRRLSIYTFLMMASALTGFILLFTDFTEGYDTSMLGMTFAAFFLCILFFRCKVFDIVDKAKDYALDMSADGLMVFDDSDRVVYENNVAAAVVDKDIPRDYFGGITDERAIYKGSPNVYAVTSSSVKHKEEYLGKSVVIHDITESYNYQESLKNAVEAATEKLENMQRQIQASFASLVEARSLETGDHIARVSVYTEMLAENLKKSGKYSDILTDDYISMMIQAAPLHDIGKISVSDTILMKPAKLTSEEFGEMKKHAASGAEVIRRIMGGLESEDYINMASEIAMYHHEWWDGSGYPEGRKGEEIPLAARIVAIADCYDALTSKRCYKPPYFVSEAIEIIKSEVGTHFDPEIVEIFLNSFDA